MISAAFNKVPNNIFMTVVKPSGFIRPFCIQRYRFRSVDEYIKVNCFDKGRPVSELQHDCCLLAELAQSQLVGLKNLIAPRAACLVLPEIPM